MTFETVFVFPNLLALVIIIAGGLVRGYAGFGSGLVMVPLLAFLWDPVNAINLYAKSRSIRHDPNDLPSIKVSKLDKYRAYDFCCYFRDSNRYTFTY